MKTLVAFGVSLAAALAPLAAARPAAGPPTASTIQEDDARVATGKRLFADTCANDHCHGGSAMAVDDMKVTAERVKKVIAEGLPDSGMPSFRGVFTPEQVDSIVAYVLSASAGAAPQAAPRQTGAFVPRAGTAARSHRAGSAWMLR